jgi:hypothetical protein
MEIINFHREPRPHKPGFSFCGVVRNIKSGPVEIKFQEGAE